MKKILFLTFFSLLFSCNNSSKKDVYTEDLKAYQHKQNLKFHDANQSPLTKEGLKKFKKLAFYPIDEKYKVVAKLEKTINAPVFEMPTTTDRKPLYIKYGTVTFTIDGVEQKLPIYQNKDAFIPPQYINYLFLPFTDKTSGNGSYGGGRYLDLLTTDEKKDGTILIDFNKAYNPLCAYNESFSCPITPKENVLSVEILAGVKNYKKE
ncbi:MAG: DUF1684 domain-containing protein [Polaribacter sp.]|nr:DUF1684 domain-containing protein [Polaribacter sp.]MDG1810330.1 DUF1684 domain-containing protein [Polaribacter sp.]MDG1994303.1 DUF1684 domain-containing protein [Polaribacter sp.]